MRSVANLTYTERTLAATEAIEAALKADFKKVETEAVTRIPFEYGGQTYDLRNRAERMTLVAAIQDDYYREHGEFNQRRLDEWYAKGSPGQRPSPAPVNAAMLDRLSNVILHDELTDDDRMKARNTEYPFFSDYQLARRREGKHQGKREGVVGREVSLGLAHSVGVDGQNYAQPTRRERSDSENAFVDEVAVARNKERKERYDAFTGPQPIRSYWLPGFEPVDPEEEAAA